MLAAAARLQSGGPPKLNIGGTSRALASLLERTDLATGQVLRPQPPQPRQPGKPRKLPLILLLLGFFALSTALNIANPIWEGIDEPGHFQYVKYVAETHQLPSTDVELPNLSVDDRNCQHVHCIARGQLTDRPPLYYVLVAPFVMPIDLESYVSWVPNPYFTWWNYPLRYGAAIHTLTEAWPYQGMVLGVHVMRAVSGLMGVASVAAIYFTALALSRRRSFALLAAGISAVTPGFLLTSATVSNDNAAVLTGSLALLCGVKALTDRSHAGRWLALFAITTGLAQLAKGNMLFLLPVAGLLLLILWWRQRTAQPLAWKIEGAAFAGIVLVAGLLERFKLQKVPHGIRYQVGYQTNILHQALVHPGCQCPGPGQAYWGSIPDLFDTYWGSFGWETFHLPPAFYPPFVLVTVVAVLGVCLTAGRMIRRRSSISAAGFGFLLAAFLVLLAGVIYRNIVTNSDGGTTHARFLFPAIAASSIFLATGLWSLPAIARKAAFGGFFALALAAVGYSIWIVPRAFGPTAPVYGDLISAGAEHPANIAFEHGLSYRGMNLDPSAVHAGQQIHLRLFWAAYRKVDFDYSGFVRLDGGGAVIHGPDHGLGQGVKLLSHSWQTGEIIPDDWTLTIPTDARQGVYAIKIGVYDYRDMKPIKDQDAQVATTIGRVTVQP